jgi:hypothetical protein
VQWKKLSESIYPNLRGSDIPADLFDQVVRLRDEYRKAHPAQTTAGKL